VSIHVDLQNLAVNTILQFQHIPDLDAALLGLDSAQDTEEEDKDSTKHMLNFNTYDESILCARAFRVLKNLVFEISADTVDFPQATPLVDSVYRWITSPQSRLYDPALHKLVQKLIKKVFLQLLAEMKRLGARLVYASFNKLIIATDKHRDKDAKEYFNFIKKTIIQKRELFQYLHMEPVNYWEVLLFKDVQNYVAVNMVKQSAHDILDADGLEEQEAVSEEDSIASQDDSRPDLLIQVLIATYFPEKVKAAIVVVLVQLVTEIRAAKQHVLRSLTPADRAAAAAHQSRMKAADGQLGAMSAQERQDEVISDLIAEWHRGEQATSSSSDQSGVSSAILKLAEAEKKILQDIASLLYETCRDLKKMALASEEEFKAHSSQMKHLVVPGFNLDNPPLEFIKVCCYMLSLKKSFTGQIQALKRNLLRDVGVREFAPEAEFIDPGHSYMIPNVVRAPFCGLHRLTRPNENSLFRLARAATIC
jgi:DNA polymerase epsilon subunit 1